MKKVIRIMGLACMTGLLAFATSCKKDQEANSEIEVRVPTFTVDDEGGERAYIDANFFFNWLAGDQIRVYNVDAPDELGHTSTVSAIYHNITGQGASARFSGPSLGAVKSEKYRYLYPVDMVAADPTDLQQNSNRETFYVPNVQEFNAYEAPNHPMSMVDANSMPMAVKVNNLKSSATLMHMFGIADIQLRADQNNTSDVVVTAVKIIDNDFALWGTASVMLHPVDMDTLNAIIDLYRQLQFDQFQTKFASYVIGTLGYTSQAGNLPTYTAVDEEEARTIVMNCVRDNHGVTLSTDPYHPTEFCFLLRPLALSRGFQVVVQFEGREDLVINNWKEFDLGEVSARCIRPAKIKTFRYQLGITN